MINLHFHKQYETLNLQLLHDIYSQLTTQYHPFVKKKNSISPSQKKQKQLNITKDFERDTKK